MSRAIFPERHAPGSRGPDLDRPLKFMVVSILSNELRIRQQGEPEGGASPAISIDNVQSDAYYEKIAHDYASPANAATDPSQIQHVIYMIGRTSREDGSRSVCVAVPYHLGFVVEMPDAYSGSENARKLIDLLNETKAIKSTKIGRNWHRVHLTPNDYEIRRQTRAVGWEPDLSDPSKPRSYTTILIKTRNRRDYETLTRFLSAPFQFERHSDFQVSLWETVDYYSPQLRFSIETGIDPGGWVQVDRLDRLAHWTALAQTDIFGLCAANMLRADPADERIEPLTRACLDLECINGTRADRQKHKDIGLDVFPDPSQPDHKIIMAGLTFYMADDRQIRFLLQLDHEESAERREALRAAGGHEDRLHRDERFNRGTNQPFTVDMPYTCVYFRREGDLIVALRDLLVWMDPDMVVSFNGDRFDYPYLLARAKLLGAAPTPADPETDQSKSGCARLTQWGRLAFDHWTIIRRVGKKMDIFDYALDFKNKPDLTPQISGRISLDLRVLIMSLKANPKFRFQSTSLDHVSDRFLGDKKIPMGHNKIFDSWFGNMEDQTPDEQRMWLGHYCVKDVELPLRIIDNQFLVQYLMQMARVTHTSPHNIINNGQLMRVCAQFCHQAHSKNYFVNHCAIKPYPYQGACVLDPLIGFYGGSGETLQSCAAKIAEFNDSVANDDPDPNDGPELTMAQIDAAEAAAEAMPDFLRGLPERLVKKLMAASRESVESVGGVMLDRKEMPDAELWYNKRKVPAWLVLMLEQMPLLDRIEYESDDIVLTLDFMSLYPSIMRTNRLCPSNYRFRNRKLTGAEEWNAKHTQRVYGHTRDDEPDDGVNDDMIDAPESESESESEADDGPRVRGQNAVETTLTASDPSGVVGPDDPHYDPNYTTIRVFNPKTGTSRYHQFTVHQEGIFTELLTKLLDERVVYKDKIKAEKKKRPTNDAEAVLVESMIAVFDCRQQALKISANSVYGATGFAGDMKMPIAMCPLAESVTAIGRQMIGKTKRAVETKFSHLGTRVIYGDSVTADTPVMLLVDNCRVVTVRIDEVATELAGSAWHPWHGDKLAMEPAATKSVKVLSDDAQGRAVFVPLHRVIKHETSKAVYRIVTGYGAVDVTADHSLLDQDGRPVKAADVRVGQRLRHVDMADVARQFMTDGRPPAHGLHGADKQELHKYFLALECQTRATIMGGTDGIELGVQVDSAIGLSGSSDSMAIKSIELLPPDVNRVVYDLQTESHHFHVGPGGLVVHNTDSVMVHMLQPNDTVAWQNGDQIAHYITTNEFGGEHDFNEIQFEKGTRGYSLYSKKCYIGQAKEKATDPLKEDKKGICTVRRDKPQVLTDLVTKLSQVAGCCFKLRRDVIARLMIQTCIDHFEHMIDFTHGLEKYVICQSISKTEDEYRIDSVDNDGSRAILIVSGTRPPKTKLAAFEAWFMTCVLERLGCGPDNFRPFRTGFLPMKRLRLALVPTTARGQAALADASEKLETRTFVIDKQNSSAQINMARRLEKRTGATISKGDAVYYVHVVGPSTMTASQKVETPMALERDWKTRIDRHYYVANKIEDQATKHLKIFVPPEVIQTVFHEYRNAMTIGGQDVRAMMSGEPARVIRRNTIMRALNQAIRANRLPVRNMIPGPLVAKAKRQTKDEKKRAMAKDARRLDSFLRPGSIASVIASATATVAVANTSANSSNPANSYKRPAVVNDAPPAKRLKSEQPRFRPLFE